jgi:hypothetical protein
MGVPATNLVVLDRPDDEDTTREPVHFPVHLLLGPHTGSSTGSDPRPVFRLRRDGVVVELRAVRFVTGRVTGW